MTGAQARARIRAGEFSGPTAGLAPANVQANLVIVPSDFAPEMRLLCERNPVPCPLIEQANPGAYEFGVAPESDLRVDVPGYRVWRDGVLTERRRDIVDLWDDDLVAFLIGCSFSFERALQAAGLPVRHLDLNCNVPMYHTSLRLAPAGPFFGNMVVSMRPYQPDQVEAVREVTRWFTTCHGEPIHWGDPRAIGIADLAKPDEGDAVRLEPGEVPVFWGCGVTPQAVAIASKIPLLITHEPGHMFITDLEHDASAHW